MQEIKKIVIKSEGIGKEYTYYKKEAGLKGSIKNLFHREKLKKHAVKNLSFEIFGRRNCRADWIKRSRKDNNS
ncbi:lipopolysaccharide export system ATP-binding protein LptB [Fusobacterium necrophorum subsp. funduliforme 1_1_36S]|nr:lipopolysaccharide export system ATP-binding protein LptB [Fusobacterium necrophorum subsp. funduliforme 1_1_36S]